MRNTALSWSIMQIRPTPDVAQKRSVYRKRSLKPGGSEELFRLVKDTADRLVAAAGDLVTQFPNIQTEINEQTT